MSDDDKKRPADTRDGKFFDIAHPGSSAPSPTSRPIIVTHRPMTADPMMQAIKDDVAEHDTADRASTDDQSVAEHSVADLDTEPKAEHEHHSNDDPDEHDPAKLPLSTHKKIIEAPADLTQDAQVQETRDTHNAATESSDDDTTTSTDDSAASADNSGAVVDAVAGQATDHKQQDEAAKQAAARAAKVAELVEQKTYFVPINVSKHQRGNKIVTAAVALTVTALIVAGVLLLT